MSKLKAMLFKKFRMLGRFTRFIPILNDIKLRSAKMEAKNTIFLGTKIDARGENNVVRIDQNCVLKNCLIHISGSNNQVVLHEGIRANGAEIWIEDDNNKVEIGEKTNLCGRIKMACIEGKEIKIGKGCLCSSDIDIRTGDSHSIVDLDGNRVNLSSSVIIGNHVWIGTKVTILKGAVIPDNCVVGARALVTAKNFDSNTVLAGCPAQVVKKNINWDAKRIK